MAYYLDDCDQVFVRQPRKPYIDLIKFLFVYLSYWLAQQSTSGSR